MSNFIDLHTNPRILTSEVLHNQINLLDNSIDNLENELSISDKQYPDIDNISDLIEIEEYKIPDNSIPIRCDIRTFPWKKLGNWCKFDVILMDPPWQLASKTPTRGVALGYSQLPNKDIMDMPIPSIQINGFIFIWAINSRYSFTLDLMKHWGYTFVDDITWIKSTINGRLAKGHGFYLQHAKESCLVGKKGKDYPYLNSNIKSDIIISQRRGQSQKPEELYNYIESLIPNGKYLEIFA